MRALSVRQPYVEAILRGVKTIEYRPVRTSIIDEEFYLYASTAPGNPKDFELMGVKPGDLPTGVLLGTVRIVKCTPCSEPRQSAKTRDEGTGTVNERFEWHLAGAKRLARPIKPERHAQPSWFYPFERDRPTAATSRGNRTAG